MVTSKFIPSGSESTSIVQRIPLSLNSVRAARELRAGMSRETVGSEFGISLRKMEKIASAYGSVPDAVLMGIERLLNDREKLRRLISNLLHQNDLLP